MPLQETLLLRVGPAIATGILKVWLRDKKLALDVSTGLVDILKALAPEVAAHRRGERHFAEIGDRVAESLLPLFEREGAKLDEGDREAVALAAANTLETSPLDPEFLAQQNLDPSRLTQQLLESEGKATLGFSEAAVALYRRILSETSQRIVDIASQLPSFTEHTFSEVLKREDELLDVTKRTLEEVRRVREASERGNPEADAARFEQDYRLAVARNLDHLELLGADLTATSRRYNLSVAYVTLQLNYPRLKARG